MGVPAKVSILQALMSGNKNVTPLPSARKVDTAPSGYSPIGTFDNKDYYRKTDRSVQELPLAKGGGKGSAAYEAWLGDRLKEGVTPEELASKKYISGDEVEKYRKLYKPSVSIDDVYTEKAPSPTPTTTPTKVIESEPNKSFVIDVRGDEPGKQGAYYFPKDYDTWKKITSDPRLMSEQGSASTNVKGDQSAAGAAYNMNHSVFLDNIRKYAPELEEKLGVAYTRDSKNASKFVPKGNFLTSMKANK